MKHVGGNDDVELRRLKSLREGIALDVERLVTNEGEAFEFAGGAASKGRRNICIAVVRAVRRHDVCNPRGGRAGARPDFNDAQLATGPELNFILDGQRAATRLKTRSPGDSV